MLHTLFIIILLPIAIFSLLFLGGLISWMWSKGVIQAIFILSILGIGISQASNTAGFMGLLFFVVLIAAFSLNAHYTAKLKEKPTAAVVG